MQELGLWSNFIITIAELFTGTDLVPATKLEDVSDNESDPEYLENQGWERHVRNVSSPYFEVLRKTESITAGWFSSESVAESEEEVLYRIVCPTFLKEPVTIECLEDKNGAY